MSLHARLTWRCRRGTKELDLLLQTWLSQAFDASSEAEQQAFIALLDWPDDKLSYLLLGVNLADDTEINALARKIRQLSAAQS